MKATKRRPLIIEAEAPQVSLGPERNLQRALDTRPASHAPKSPKREAKRQPRPDMSRKK